MVHLWHLMRSLSESRLMLGDGATLRPVAIDELTCICRMDLAVMR